MSTLLKSRNMIAVLVLLVFLLFLFPVKVGSFQSTHGPTSTLEKSLAVVLLCSLLLVIAAPISPMFGGANGSGIMLCQQARCSSDRLSCALSLRC